MVDGRRITSKSMLDVVTMVYGGLVNKKIVAGLQARGCNAIGLTGADLNLISARKRPVQEIDYGFVGDVVDVNSRELRILIGENVVPVVAPLTHDEKDNF
jgi:acetylglutamate kinase